MLLGCGGPANEEATGAVAQAPLDEAANARLDSLRKPSPEGARVWFITPGNGTEVTSPVVLEFGLEGMELRPAGDAAEHSGHHHILVDTGLPPMNLPIPTDANHVHFGLGQTSVELSLEPGPHTLQLLLGDDLHIPHDPPVMSQVLHITVQ